MNELPANWQEISIGEIGKVITGKTPPTTHPEYFGGSIPFITPSDMDGRKFISQPARYLTEQGVSRVKGSFVPAKSVLVSCIGSDMGKVVLSERPSVTNQQINSVVVNKNFSADFVYYNLSNKQEELQRLALGGSTMPILNKGHFSQIRVISPPLPEQRAIAHVLGTLDDKIELNRRTNQTLEALARALFRSWFVDFEPVKAKAAGFAPHGLDEETAALFPNMLVDSVLGMIPGGWNAAPIGDCVQVVGGGTPKTDEPLFWEGGTNCWVTPKDLSGLKSPILLDTERKITDLGRKKISSGLLAPGTVLLSSRAPIGYLAINKMPVAINQGFIAMICNGPLPKEYVFHWTQEHMEEIEGRANGSTFMEISKAAFRPIPALIPGDEVLAKFVACVAPMYDKITSNLEESTSLATLRDALLPRLLSGQERLPADFVARFATDAADEPNAAFGTETK